MNEASFFVLKKCENELEAMCQLGRAAGLYFPMQKPIKKRAALSLGVGPSRRGEKGRFGLPFSEVRRFQKYHKKCRKKKESSIRVEFELFVDDFGPAV